MCVHCDNGKALLCGLFVLGIVRVRSGGQLAPTHRPADTTHTTHPTKSVICRYVY